MIEAQNEIDPVDTHVGRRLLLARKMRGWSQGYLGDLAGITFQQIQKYERGINRVSASRLAHLASYLKTPIGWFFEEIPGETINNEKAQDFADVLNIDECAANPQEAYGLVLAYYKIRDKERRRAVFAIVQSLASSKAEAAQAGGTKTVE